MSRSREIDHELVEAMLTAVLESPGISANRIAKDVGLSLVDTLRVLNQLATDNGLIEGPALVRLETRSDTSLLTRVVLTEAGKQISNPLF